MRTEEVRRREAHEGHRDDDNAAARGYRMRAGSGYFGLAIVILLGTIGWALHIDPRALVCGADLTQSPAGRASDGVRAMPRAAETGDRTIRDAADHRIAAMFAETTHVWTEILAKEQGIQYVPPRLVFYKTRTGSACGGMLVEMGPIYCPLDNSIYVDPVFFPDLKQRLGDAGNFAYAFFIAHEIGHRVQDQLGILRQARAAQRSAFGGIGNAVSVRIELMADCFAGVFAARASAEDPSLTRNRINQMAATAQAIGDDRLQLAALGRVVPNSFTHGTSDERAQWFTTGFAAGSIEGCNTFTLLDSKP